MKNQIQKTTEQKTLRDILTGPDFAEQVAKVSTKHLTPDRMIRIAETTLKRVPKLQECTPETVFVALLNLSAAGLEPDGTHAHLIPYGKECQLIIDYKGLLTIARRNGVHCTTKVVYENDFFKVEEDDGNGQTKVTHVPEFKKPRGAMCAVYSRAKWDGVDFFDYEIMQKEEVDKIRNSSKAGKSGPWSNWYDEMARKTVIRRHSKRWPLTAEIHQAINNDDDTPDFEKRVKQAKPIFSTPKEIPAQSESEVVNG